MNPCAMIPREPSGKTMLIQCSHKGDEVHTVDGREGSIVIL